MNAPGEGLLDNAAHRAQTLALPWLVADVGGTNARFGWVDDACLTVKHVQTLPVAQHAGPAEAVAAYLQILPAAGGRPVPRPLRSAWALATGLLSKVVPPHELDAQLQALTQRLLGFPQPALEAVKQYLGSAPRGQDTAAVLYGASLLANVLGSR
jgi:hypothetical protein